MYCHPLGIIQQLNFWLVVAILINTYNSYRSRRMGMWAHPSLRTNTYLNCMDIGGVRLAWFAVSFRGQGWNATLIKLIPRISTWYQASFY